MLQNNEEDNIVLFPHEQPASSINFWQFSAEVVILEKILLSLTYGDGEHTGITYCPIYFLNCVPYYLASVTAFNKLS